MLGESGEMKHIKNAISQVAPTNLTVVIQGRSGTGKEIIARNIHLHSLRKERQFIALDCGTLPEALVESELFGYEKGAFTGADKKKLGQFELASQGTLFLDEIGNLPVTTQAKLLRVLQEKEIQHLGGQKGIKVDIRIIVATNMPLEEAVREGRFREDLFHRLNEFNIEVPPLCERTGDIALLTGYFLAKANEKLRKNIKGFSPEAIELMTNYSWPGNVRELKNTVTRAVLLAEDEILPGHLPAGIKGAAGSEIKTEKGISLKEASGNAAGPVEKSLIEAALKDANNSKSRAAEILGVSRKTLYNKMKKLGM